MKNVIRALIALVCMYTIFSLPVTAAIATIPFAPASGDTLQITVAETCYSITRWEQIGGRVIFYGDESPTGVAITPCPDSYRLSIPNIGGSEISLEVWGRRLGARPPDGYVLLDSRILKLGSATTRRDPPTTIRVTSGIAQALSLEAARTAIGTVQVQDASGLPVENARVVRELRSLRGPTPLPSGNDLPSYTSSVGISGFTASQTLDVAYQPGDYVTYRLSLADALAPKPAPAFAVVGIVSPQFAPYAFPVVEYQVLSRANPTFAFAFFLASDATTMQSLDSVQSTFLRTYGAFTALTSNAPGAVPVCRFFSDGRNGRLLTHWFTADAAECATKRADPNWIYEGTPFWTFAARAEGYCPPSTRAVTRLLYANVAKPVSAIARYTQYLDIKNASLAASPTATGYRWIDDGVAFCAPE